MSHLVLRQISLKGRVCEAFQSSYTSLMSEKKQSVKRFQLTKCMRLRIALGKVCYTDSVMKETWINNIIGLFILAY